MATMDIPPEKTDPPSIVVIREGDTVVRQTNKPEQLSKVERTALWCSLEIIAHDRRPIDDDDADTIRRAAALIKAMQ